jgi:hypothetical protein
VGFGARCIFLEIWSTAVGTCHRGVWCQMYISRNLEHGGRNLPPWGLVLDVYFSKFLFDHLLFENLYYKERRQLKTFLPKSEPPYPSHPTHPSYVFGSR